MKQTVSVHIVRRYGLVGGMEAYVYELTRALAKKGHKVFVLCESCETQELMEGVKVICLGNPCRKPRWLAQWIFSRKVATYASELPNKAVIHSHERSSVHHVTTFHGPPFLDRKKRLFDFLSPRIHMWTALEKAELTASQVKVILPNSELIAKQLAQFYPEVAEKIDVPAYPGVSPGFSNISRPSGGVTIGFLGREWKRKGLELAVDIIASLREKNPAIHFVVAGCAPEEITPLFNDLPQDSYTLLGWAEPQSFFEKVDLLLHPAKAEPFGMAIAEANAVGIPVVISDRCGIASLITAQQGAVCSLEEGVDKWVDSCQSALLAKEEVPSLGLTWDKLADQHINLYQTIEQEL